MTSSRAIEPSWPVLHEVLARVATGVPPGPVDRAALGCLLTRGLVESIDATPRTTPLGILVLEEEPRVA